VEETLRILISQKKSGLSKLDQYTSMCREDQKKKNKRKTRMTEGWKRAWRKIGNLEGTGCKKFIQNRPVEKTGRAEMIKRGTGGIGGAAIGRRPSTSRKGIVYSGLGWGKGVKKI